MGNRTRGLKILWPGAGVALLILVVVSFEKNLE